jgi:transcription initiation factor TFIID subunit 10
VYSTHKAKPTHLTSSVVKSHPPILIIMSGESSTQPPAIAPKEQPVASSSTASDATKVNGTAPAQNGNNNATTDENKEAQDQSDIELTKLFTAKREEDMARRDRTLAEFLVMLDGYKPLVCLH